MRVAYNIKFGAKNDHKELYEALRVVFWVTVVVMDVLLVRLVCLET